MPHDDPATRPKRSRDPFKAAYEVFQEAIGEKPRTSPREKSSKHSPEKPPRGPDKK